MNSPVTKEAVERLAAIEAASAEAMHRDWQRSRAQGGGRWAKAKLNECRHHKSIATMLRALLTERDAALAAAQAARCEGIREAAAELKPYLESYRSMQRCEPDGRVDLRSIIVDIDRNMIGGILALATPPGEKA